MKKWIYSIVLIISASAVQANQQQDIESVLKDIHYLQDAVKKLQIKYKNDQSKIRFNYNGLLQQLKASEIGIKAYLNQNIKEIRLRPEPPVDPSLIRGK